jgi:hypothetical protein
MSRAHQTALTHSIRNYKSIMCISCVFDVEFVLTDPTYAVILSHV